MEESTITKICTRCGETKTLDAFGYHPQAKQHRHPNCRSCRAELARIDRVTRGDVINARRREMAAADEAKARKAANALSYRTRNADRVKDLKARHYQRNHDAIRAQHRAYRLANPRAKKGTDLRRYGLTIEDYDRLWTAQAGCCALCGKDGRRALHVDHDHDTGAIRGLLCDLCNMGLGVLGDDLPSLRQAVAYLERLPVHPGPMVPHGSKSADQSDRGAHDAGTGATDDG